MSPHKEILTASHTVMSFELDAFGHVNNAVYLQYLEKARNEFMLAKQLDFNRFFEWGRFPVVVRAQLEFKNPARANDRLEIIGWISSHTQTSFTLQYEIRQQTDGRIVLRAETGHVFVDGQNRPCRIPEEFKEKFLASRDTPKRTPGT